ncbi:hypothetical protein QR685DRAFT_414568, partial [Neurospora intermedia]
QSQSRNGVSELKRALLDSPMSMFSLFLRLLNVQAEVDPLAVSALEGKKRFAHVGPQEWWGV